MDGVDCIALLAKVYSTAVREDRSIVIMTTDGQELRGTLHDDWSLGDARKLLGRTLDLRHAYKQLARRPSYGYAAVVAVFSLSWNVNGVLRSRISWHFVVFTSVQLE